MWRTEWHEVNSGPATLALVVVVEGGSVVTVVEGRSVVAVVEVAALDGVSEVATAEVATPRAAGEVRSGAVPDARRVRLAPGLRYDEDRGHSCDRGHRRP